MNPPPAKVFQVSELARRIKFLIEDDIGVAWVEGECSNLKLNAASGHLYFTLKDAEAQIACAFFAGRRRGNPFTPREGARARVLGQVTAYEKSGQYQVVVHRMEEAGEGALRAAFERLKARLLAQGWFDSARKRPLPSLPARIGLVTSPTGAAIRDMLIVLRRRYPDRVVRIVPARVQGAGAAEEIAAALDLLNQHRAVDVIIVGRGGGSLEDLQAFNEEVVAAAIHRSAIPVISAVGHETDTTISDLVADVRAPTPSAAAELVIRPKADLEEAVSTLARRLAGALRSRAHELRNRLLRAQGSPALADPARLVDRRRRTVDALSARVARGTTGFIQTWRLELERSQTRMTRRLEGAARDAQRRVDEAQTRLSRRLEQQVQADARALAAAEARLDAPARRALQAARESVRRAEGKLQALSPRAVLARGFSITLGPDGRALTTPAAVRKGDPLRTLLADGEITSIVADGAPET